eukprot:TRINITY_DN733_c0_g1_i5.p1 TRINITY_DN733_c0_g1~~TRINITY_DN733_c0_g1_i5.p1  ORF type:complete len:483 (-),score=128.97 TRINITY_DN733_c0_g1_i5:86-1432(-)
MAAGTRLESILGMVNRVQAVPSMRAMGLKLEPQPLPIIARRLAPEKVSFKTDSCVPSAEKANWSGETQRATPLITLSPNVVLYLYPRRLADAAEIIMTTLQRVMGPMSLNLGTVQNVPLARDFKQDYFEALQAKVNPQVQFVICLLPNDQKDRYDGIKRALTSQVPVPSQLILSKHAQNQQKLMTVATRIAHQINCKLGGALWQVNIPLPDAMIVGIDVCHSRGKSVVGVCASTNKSFTQYTSATAMQQKNQEIADGLKPLIETVLAGYQRANAGGLPNRVFVYRDGVGDGDVAQVLNVEVKLIEQAFASVRTLPGQPPYSPTLTVIIVKKKIHTRLFATGGRKNPEPGTVCDTGCTHKDWFDFYVVSNSVTQGTVTPTHYHVIKNGTRLPAYNLQLLTYKLTHLYFNWPGTIKVPAPCMYAHKLAFLVGQSTHAVPDQCLSNKLFFL